ncbi:hypothetical protein C4588_02945 [Candidatus Parcubacteria bacterium]|nr:MAG: hypothetical protein C4588_02945 [Candidatus Parcubacteria bacterium]
MTLGKLYQTNEGVLTSFATIEVVVKGNYLLSGFEAFGPIRLIRKGIKGKLNVEFKSGQRLMWIDESQDVIQES